jgi:hypothetical protein
MKVYKVTLMIVDHDGLDDVDEITAVIEQARYANRCIIPEVVDIEEKEIGEWSDDHPLNQTATCVGYFKEMFEMGDK